MLILIGLLILFLTNCSKSKTVFICGDHKCINKEEAEQYFEENLSIQVKILNEKPKDEINLVELNLMENKNGVKKINVSSKQNYNKNLKILSNEEIIEIKRNIKNKKNIKKIAKKNTSFKKMSDKKTAVSKSSSKTENSEIKNDIKINIRKKSNIQREAILDVCTLIEKCSIHEISKYLLENGNKKKFPDLTVRQ